LAVLLTTSGGNDRLPKLLGAIHGDHVETRGRIPDLLDLVPVEGATPNVLATVPLAPKDNDHPILRPRQGI